MKSNGIRWFGMAITLTLLGAFAPSVHAQTCSNACRRFSAPHHHATPAATTQHQQIGWMTTTDIFGNTTRVVADCIGGMAFTLLDENAMFVPITVSSTGQLLHSLSICGSSGVDFIEFVTSNVTCGGVTIKPLLGNGNATMISGMSQGDTLINAGGTHGTICGGDGADQMAAANTGVCALFGGLGGDTMGSFSAASSLFGEDGNDSLLAGQGYCNGGAGTDTCRCGVVAECSP